MIPRRTIVGKVEGAETVKEVGNAVSSSDGDRSSDEGGRMVTMFEGSSQKEMRWMLWHDLRARHNCIGFLFRCRQTSIPTVFLEWMGP